MVGVSIDSGRPSSEETSLASGDAVDVSVEETELVPSEPGVPGTDARVVSVVSPDGSVQTNSEVVDEDGPGSCEMIYVDCPEV